MREYYKNNPDKLNTEARKRTTKKYQRTKKGLLTTILQRQKYTSKSRQWPPPNYSLQQLRDKFLNDQKFNSIYKNWIKNGYQYYDAPSIDRVDYKRSYTLDNIQILSWRDNRRKADFNGNEHSTTEVIMLDMNGSFIKKFPSIKEAVKETNCNQGNISSVCLGLRNHTGGYKWQYGSYKRNKE